MSEKPVIDTLVDLDRLKGASRTIAEGTEARSVTESQAAEVVHKVKIYCDEKKISQKRLGRDVGYSASVISEVFNASYRGDWRQVVKDLDAWLANELEANAVPRTTAFCWTSVAKEIRTIARLMQQTRKIGLVYGPDTSGIGKSMAMAAIRDAWIDAAGVRDDPGQLDGLLRGIARAMELQDSRSNRALYERIISELRGTPRLLLIDQVHKLCGAKQDRPLYLLTEIWEATRAPQLWAGTTDIKTYLERGERRGDEPLAQIRSRISYARDLLQRTRAGGGRGPGEALFSILDIRSVFGRNKVKISEDGIKFLWQLACIPHSGALRLCENVVMIATIIAEAQARDTIGRIDLAAALQDSVTTADYMRIESGMTETSSVMSMAG